MRLIIQNKNKITLNNQRLGEKFLNNKKLMLILIKKNCKFRVCKIKIIIEFKPVQNNLEQTIIIIKNLQIKEHKLHNKIKEINKILVL